MPLSLDVPAAIASNFMHDRIFADVILAEPPSGKFILDVRGSLPALLTSNGGRITPILNMAKACSLYNPARLIWLIVAVRYLTALLNFKRLV